jgi:uncharacterized protein
MANYLEDGYHGEAAAYAPESERAGFIRRAYLHLAGSVAALVGIEAVLLKAVESPAGQQFLRDWFTNPVSLLVMLAFFIGTGFFARYMARGDMPVGIKYLGLGLYTVLQAVILLPILYVATNNPRFGDTQIVNQAAFLTLVTFAGLTLTVFVTKRDFSGLGPILMVASFVILGVIVAGILFGFGMGLWLSFLCIALAAGYILYDTSNVLHHYGTNEHVGAALELLSDVVLLFYHILRVLMLSRND